MPNNEGLSSRDFANLKSALDEAAIVAITDAKGVITYANKKFCSISKYEARELIGNTHRIVNSGLHPREFFVNMWRTIASGEVWEGEIRNRAKDGTYYWVHTTIVPFMDEKGRPESYVSVRYDITPLVAVQEQLKIHAKKLEVSNRELQDFASVAAHDLQEPLRKIRSFSDRVQTKAKGALDPEIMDYLDRIQNSASRMQTLIDDLLSYSRVTTKAEPFVPVDMGQVLRQVVADLEIRLEQTKGKVEIKDLPVLDADPTQMYQLMQNLINNALKFHKPDTPPVVTVTSEKIPGANAVKIFIRDNGIGFDQKYLDRIFSIFQRLHGRHEYQGTGIGLAVCRKIVDRHGGFITAESIPGQGATFIVQLPIRQKKEEES